MIKVQMNLRIQCDCPDCDNEESFSEYFPYGSTDEDIMEEYLYNRRYAGWHMIRATKKIYCSEWCEEKDK